MVRSKCGTTIMDTVFACWTKVHVCMYNTCSVHVLYIIMIILFVHVYKKLYTCNLRVLKLTLTHTLTFTLTHTHTNAYAILCRQLQ